MNHRTTHKPEICNRAPLGASSRLITLAMAGALVALTMLTYWPALSCGFVSYDDPDYITKNYWVQQGLTRQSVSWALTTTSVANWHPLTWLSHLLDWTLYGPNPRGHHLTSVVLHAMAATTLFLALLRMTAAPWRSLLVAAFFGLHPQHVQSVAWVAERKDVLSALLAFLTILAYLSFVERGGKLRYALLIVTYALGLLAKPMLVTLPVLLLLLDTWPLRRFRVLDLGFGNHSGASGDDRGTPSNAESKIQNPKSLAGLIIEKLPLFILAGASCIMTIIAQKRGGTVGTLEMIPLAARIANAVVGYAWYFWKTFWPTDLAAFYPHPGYWPTSTVVWSTIVVASVSLLACLIARRRPAFMIGWLWFLISLVPVIGIVQVGSQAYADRYSYLPHVGLFIMIVYSAPNFSRRTWAMGVTGLATGVIVIACVVGTRHEIQYWANTVTLFERCAAVTRNNWLAHIKLGNEILRSGNVPGAIEQFELALLARPGLADAEFGIGQALAKSGSLDDAAAHWQRAVEMQPEHVEARYSLARALVEQQKINEGLAALQELTRNNPDFADAHLLLGVLLIDQHQFDQAIFHLSKAVELDPNNVHSRRELERARKERP